MRRIISAAVLTIAMAFGLIQDATSERLLAASEPRMERQVTSPALSSWKEAQATYQCCVKCSNGSYCATCRSTETCVRFCTGGGVPQPSCHQR